MKHMLHFMALAYQAAPKSSVAFVATAQMQKRLMDSTDQDVNISPSDYICFARAPFFRGLQILRMEVCGNYFHEMTLGVPFTIHGNLYEMKYLVKQILWKFQKSMKSVKFTAFEKRAPYGRYKTHYSILDSLKSLQDSDNTLNG